jgi:hypothetical protein
MHGTLYYGIGHGIAGWLMGNGSSPPSGVSALRTI